MKLFFCYLAAVNLLCFVLMGMDKRFAIKKRRRIPERVLLGLAALGGCAGEMLAMRLFRHKTLHAAFAAGLPLMTIGYCVLIFLLIM